MHKLHYILISFTIITLLVLSYTTYSLNTRVKTQESAIREIAGVLTAGGMVVAGKDGKAMVNPLLLEAWKQANQTP